MAKQRQKGVKNQVFKKMKTGKSGFCPLFIEAALRRA